MIAIVKKERKKERSKYVLLIRIGNIFRCAKFWQTHTHTHTHTLTDRQTHILEALLSASPCEESDGQAKTPRDTYTPTHT